MAVIVLRGCFRFAPKTGSHSDRSCFDRSWMSSIPCRDFNFFWPTTAPRLTRNYCKQGRTHLNHIIRSWKADKPHIWGYDWLDHWTLKSKQRSYITVNSIFNTQTCQNIGPEWNPLLVKPLGPQRSPENPQPVSECEIPIQMPKVQISFALVFHWVVTGDMSWRGSPC